MTTNALTRLVLIAAVLEGTIAIAAFIIDGAMAMVAALIGSSLAGAAQGVATAVLRPAMKATQPQFQQRWVLGMALRFASFLVLAVLMVTLKSQLPVAWMAAGYLGLMLVLLFAETRFLT